MSTTSHRLPRRKYRVTKRILTGNLAGMEVTVETDAHFEVGAEHVTTVTGNRYLVTNVELTADRP